MTPVQPNMSVAAKINLQLFMALTSWEWGIVVRKLGVCFPELL
jgi:hypothetical protein